ncbi:MAG: flagellar filament capping protein FliD [Actinomycetia bacterium]|nr:flagellar filament capping protein FliD [Actinomycetes bacterium]MCP5035295.1 flagellar filament capping protein FliD [Actinomycetes bacterium]
MSFIDGLSSGLDTSTIVNQLMQLERRPQVALTSRRDQEEAARTELSGIRSDVNGLRDLASDLRLTSGWDRLTATSSNPDAVSVQATAASTIGSYSFEVSSVATAASVYSSSVYASTDTVVTDPGASVFQSSGHQALGFSSLSGTGFSVGNISFSVTQASAAAELEGVGIPTIPITVDGTNDSIDFQVDGFNYSITLAHGTYNDEAALAAAVSASITSNASASEVAAASLSADNKLVLRTTAEGSDHSITLTGGTALGALGLTAFSSASGVDGVVEVDGTSTVISDASAGQAVTLASGGAGSIDAVLSGPLRAGSATAAQVTPGNGTLSDLVSTINSSDLGYTAQAVNTGAGYRLQLTATETGSGSTITPEAELFGTMSFEVLSEGTDAELTVQGDNPFSITSSTNTFEDLLPGVAVTVNAITTSPVTISTARDTESVTDSVEEMVTKLNDVLGRIATSTSNQPGAARSVLQGHQEARRVADQLRTALVGAVDGNELGSVGIVGIELTREGTLTFNRDKFTEALTSDPEAMTSLFSDRTSSATAGVLDRLIEAADSAASTGDGVLYTATQASERRIEDYGRQIDAVERRLELRESTLRRTYANLEVTLGGLQQQSGYLASQLSSFGGV